MRESIVYDEMKKRNIKIFGSFEACKDRLERFMIAAVRNRKITESNDPKIVHVETIPVINDEDQKVIHVEVNTDDVLDVASILTDMKHNEDHDLESLIQKYKKFVYDRQMIPDIDVVELKSYWDWMIAHSVFTQTE